MAARCPLSGQDCRDDCAWADVVVTITDDGMERDVFCAVTMIAAALVDIVGEGRCWDGPSS